VSQLLSQWWLWYRHIGKIDIRGIVADELTPDVVKLIGQAIGSESIAKGERGVVVGRDGRLSGVELMSALTK
jgi:phosphomannomutase/phosphoglucomutase